MKKRNVLWILVRDYMGKRGIIYFMTILFMGIFGSLFQIMISVTIGDLCNMAQNKSLNGLSSMLTRNLYLVMLVIAGNVINSLIYNNEAKRAAAAINNAVYTKALFLPLTFYDKHHSGEFMSKIIWDAARTGDIFGSRLRRIIMPVLTVSICTIPMFYLCPPVMSGLFSLSLLSLAVHFIMIRPMKKAAVMASDANQEITKNISNMLQGMEVIKMFPMKDRILSAYDEANSKLAEANTKQANYSSFLSGLNTAFDLMGAFWFLALGIWYITIYQGQVGALVSLYLLYGTFSWNFLQIGLYVPDLSNCLVNAERILEFMDLTEEANEFYSGEKEMESSNPAIIEIQNLTFGYEGTDEKVLQNFSAKLEQGKCIAITGKSGKGKSTLAKLMLGFYRADSGYIYFAGKSIHSMGLVALRNKIAYVPQEPYLFNVSIAENIRYGKPDAAQWEIIEAARAAHAHDFISRLEKGYDTIAGERGAKLSGGEKQRIAIARAIIKNAPVILLDEATSALDNESEYLVQDAIRNLKGEKTIIMIAHRPSTIAMADYVLEI